MSRIPDKRVADFERAGQLAVDVVYSEAFVEQLREYMGRNPPAPGDTVWAGLTPEKIAADVRAKLPKLPVSTFGGIRGRWLQWFYGNTGLDGGTDGPVLINRYALGGRRVSQISNTIVHEAAHRAGMTHPESDKPGGLVRAFCQPPYVIGTIVERLAEGPNWRWNASQHCTTFKTTS